MLKKARVFLKMVRAFGWNSVLDVISSQLEYSLDEFIAIFLLATYYCHTQETISKLVQTMVRIYPDCLRTDKVQRGYDPDVVNSWFSLRALILVNENMTSEADLEKVVAMLKEECLK